MMEKVIEFVSNPLVFELIKGFIALNFGFLIGIFYSDWKAERRLKIEAAQEEAEELIEEGEEE